MLQIQHINACGPDLLSHFMRIQMVWFNFLDVYTTLQGSALFKGEFPFVPAIKTSEEFSPSD